MMLRYLPDTVRAEIILPPADLAALNQWQGQNPDDAVLPMADLIVEAAMDGCVFSEATESLVDDLLQRNSDSRENRRAKNAGIQRELDAKRSETTEAINWRLSGDDRLRFQIESEYETLLDWSRSATDDQMLIEWHNRLAAWEKRYAAYMPAIFTSVGELPPGSTIAEIEELLVKFATPRLPEGKPVPIAPHLSVVPNNPQPDLIQSSAEFVHGFVPPDFLIDGVLQRRFCYSMTAQTGVGKTTVAMLLMAHVATGRPLGPIAVERGQVLYFAGENPTDIQMRWLGLTREMGIDPATTDVHFIAGAMPLSQHAERISAEVTRKGLAPALVVVDTAAAYFEGEDENSNAQAVEHAKRLRSLTLLPGGPTVLILCHPTKRATTDDLIPRGGGAFLAEVDGNIALQKQDTLIGAAPQGKFRGREFAPINFELKTVYHPVLKDARGRDIPTVMARHVSETDRSALAAASRRNENLLLKAIYENPGISLRALATALKWLDSKGQPSAMRVSRAAEILAREKLIQKHRGSWQCTSAGQRELNQLESAAVTQAVTGMPLFPVPTIAN